MKKQIIADVNPHEVRVALLEDDELAEIHVELRGHERIVGNIYKGRVANILPGMQAAYRRRTGAKCVSLCGRYTL